MATAQDRFVVKPQHEGKWGGKHAVGRGFLDPIWTEEDYNKGFRDFDTDELEIRANCIMSATSQFLERLRKNATDGNGLLAGGKIHEVEGDFPLAIKWYRRALGVMPELYEAAARIAAVQIKLHDLPGALSTAIELVRDAPDLVFPALVRRRPLSSWSVLGDTLRLNGQIDAARQAYHRAMISVPHEMYAAGHYGTLLLEAGKFEEAIEVFDTIDEANGSFGPIRAAVKASLGDPVLLPTIRDSYIKNLRLIMADAV
jgi:tetratricopeptide (TPR) repeat protein